MTSASSNAVVDLSEENDNAGNQATVSSNTGESFERSCDNPECSAPRLISMVPKPVASEFVTEPMVVHQPTLINGFTTVFQIDGVGTRMEDIMNESTTASSTLDGNQKPKTVFRVVPNTHAHIVNYVVVEAAAETMQKIKANDPETMCKLLISQRLSAEQMLKKLIGKALETPTRVENACSAPAQNIAPAINKVSVAAEVQNPIVPPGVTVKRLPVREENKSANSSKAPVNPSSNNNHNNNNNRIVKKTASEPNKTTKLTTSTGTPGPSKSRITVKPASQLNKTASAPTTTRATLNSSSSKEISKSFTPTIQKNNQNSSQPTFGTETSPRNTASGARNISATRPVVWQAFPQGIASKCTSSPHKTTPPKIPPGISSRNTQSVVSSPTNNSPSLNTSGSQQAPLNSPEPLDVEQSISSTAIPVNRSPIDSNSIKQGNALKRKPDSTPVAEAVKRLRPRSPSRVQSVTPLAGNSVSIIKFSTPIPKKLPTVAKQQKLPVAPPQKPQVGKFLMNAKPKDATAIEGDNSLEASPPTELNTSVRRKSKPLMGPASKMKALKAMADAKTKTLQKDALSTCQTTLNSESGQMKIGETIITRTGSSKGGAKDSVKSPVTLTKPCSVAITDIAKSSTATDSDSESMKSNKRSRQTTKSTSEKEPSKKGNAYEALVDRYRGRFTIKKEDDQLSRKPFLRTTRSTASPKSAMKTTQKPEAPNASHDDISDSTLLTTPSAPSRVLRVVLPSTKNGIVNNPTTAPHPNLKISSVISGGETTLAGPIREVDTEVNPIIFSDDSSGPGIEQLQKELADLRRTVARLTQGKKA